MKTKTQGANNRYPKELYQWYVEHGVCWGCKKAAAEAGRVYCGLCQRRNRARRAKNDPGNAKNNARMMAVREARKAQGICVRCGANPAVEGHVRCQACLKKQREYEMVRRIGKKLKAGTL